MKKLARHPTLVMLTIVAFDLILLLGMASRPKGFGILLVVWGLEFILWSRLELIVPGTWNRSLGRAILRFYPPQPSRHNSAIALAVGGVICAVVGIWAVVTELATG